eukprot:g18536.t1
MTAPYGEALFGHKSDGQKLAELNVLCTSVVGLALAPFSGTIGDIFGLEVPMPGLTTSVASTAGGCRIVLAKPPCSKLSCFFQAVF